MYQRTQSRCSALTFIGAQFGGHLLIDDCADPNAKDSQRPSHLKGFSMRIHRNQFAPSILIHLFFDPVADDPNLDVTEESLLASNVNFPIGCAFRRRRTELPALCYSFNYAGIAHLREQISDFIELTIDTYFPNAPDFNRCSTWWSSFIANYGNSIKLDPLSTLMHYPVEPELNFEIVDEHCDGNPHIHLSFDMKVDDWSPYVDATLKCKIRYSPFSETIITSVSGIPASFGDERVRSVSFPFARPQFDIVSMKKSTDGTYAMSMLSSRIHRGSSQPPVLLPNYVAEEAKRYIRAALFLKE